MGLRVAFHTSSLLAPANDLLTDLAGLEGDSDGSTHFTDGDTGLQELAS